DRRLCGVRSKAGCCRLACRRPAWAGLLENDAPIRRWPPASAAQPPAIFQCVPFNAEGFVKIDSLSPVAGEPRMKPSLLYALALCASVAVSPAPGQAQHPAADAETFILHVKVY